MKRLFCLIFTAFSIFMISSCTGNLSVIPRGNEAVVTFSACPGKAFSDLILNLSGFLDEDSGLFDSDEIKMNLEESGFTEVSVKTEKGNVISISFVVPKSDVPFIQENGSVIYSKTSFKSFYDQLPSNFQALLDMLMAPVFTDEEMSDEEYSDLLGSVYGQEIEDEINQSVVNLQGKNISLIKLLNKK